MNELSSETSLDLDVADLGPIARANIDLRPLTVFVGPGNTGKSYLAVLVYALHRFFVGYGTGGRSFPFHDAPPNGEEKKLSRKSLDDFVRWAKRRPGGSEAFPESGILVPDSVARLVDSVFAAALDSAGSGLDGEIRRCFGVAEARTLIRRGGGNGARIVFRKNVSDGSGDPIHRLTIGSEGETTFSTTIPEDVFTRFASESENAHVIWAESHHAAGGLPAENAGDGEIVGLIKGVVYEAMRRFLPYVVAPLHLPALYLPADRTGVMHAHKVVVGSLIKNATAGNPPARAPMLSGVLADFLEQLVAIGQHHGFEHAQNALGEMIESRILGGSVRANKSESGYPFFTYLQDEWNEGDDMPLMNASSMVSELAPVVLYLRHVVRPDDLLIVEEPESHLHPAMQVEFIRRLAAVVNSGVRVLVTTHSEWLLDGLANLVERDKLSGDRERVDGDDVALRPDQVGVWLFEKKLRPGGSVAREIRLDDSGLFPSGFRDVAAALHNEWADIRDRVGEKH